jgi:hypothetical protein
VADWGLGGSAVEMEKEPEQRRSGEKGREGGREGLISERRERERERGGRGGGGG